MLAFDLDLLDPTDDEFLLGHVLDTVPAARSFAGAARTVIRCLHGIPPLYERVSRGELEFYIGRFGDGPDYMCNRFFSSRNIREHVGGLVMVRCLTAQVRTFESCAIRIIRSLQDRGCLCVANIDLTGAGALPATEHSYIYATWGILPRAEPIGKANRRDVSAVVDDVAPFAAAAVTRQQLMRAIELATRPVWERADLCWAPGHG